MQEVPSIHNLKQLMRCTRAIVFPDYFAEETDPYADFEQILRLQIATVLPEKADAITKQVLAQLPELKRLLQTDVEAVLHNDPAVTDLGEVIL